MYVKMSEEKLLIPVCLFCRAGRHSDNSYVSIRSQLTDILNENFAVPLKESQDWTLLQNVTPFLNIFP